MSRFFLSTNLIGAVMIPVTIISDWLAADKAIVIGLTKGSDLKVPIKVSLMTETEAPVSKRARISVPYKQILINNFPPFTGVTASNICCVKVSTTDVVRLRSRPGGRTGRSSSFLVVVEES